MTLYLFGCGCASLGFAARWISVSILEHITALREKQDSCEHTWGETSYLGAYPTRFCKWCKKQQHYRGDKETGHWEDW